jgi:hypothetical protein
MTRRLYACYLRDRLPVLRLRRMLGLLPSRPKSFPF